MMTVPPPEYGEEDRLQQEPGRLRQPPERPVPPDGEDEPEREIEQFGRQEREVGYLDPEDNEAHAPGTVCARCGAVIAADQDGRRLANGQWIHEVCPVYPAGSAPPEGGDLALSGQPGKEPALPRQEEPQAAQPAEDPGYLIETGEAAGEDGSVAPIIGGLPAVEGSAWDIGAPLDERGANLADEQGSPPDQAGHQDTRGN